MIIEYINPLKNKDWVPESPLYAFGGAFPP